MLIIIHYFYLLFINFKFIAIIFFMVALLFIHHSLIIN